ncbi:Imm1 family immunity protein [Plantactinospora sp. BB1]|uniref:Imm1 family immunity protein n=1 Tax=Plantactinospora sp. BB1 TaxID=2071627 RepID=UPI00131F01A8|nr:Imm1 family immunity protein [Plantactinospora sp. BB1]
MTYRISYDMDEEVLPDAEAVSAFFEKRAHRIAPHGRRANAYWIGPAGGEDVMRVDVDYDAGRAALRWLPDNSHGVELDPGAPIVVLESSEHPPVTIPGTLARVSIDLARAAVAAYIRTGQRPSSVAWAAG